MARQSLTLTSCTTSICKLEKFIQLIAVKCNVCKDKYPDILISLTEAVNNAIIHGNKHDKSKTVEVVWCKTDKGLSFTVKDQGLGFNPSSLPDPTCDELINCCGGRGVFLIKQLADDVHFLNNGNTVEMHFCV